MIKILLLVLIITLVGCTRTEVVRIHNPVVCTAYQKPDPIVTRDIILHPIQDKEDIWWVGVDSRSYGNLAINNSAMLEYIIQQKAVLNYLEECIQRHNRGVSP